MEKRSCLQPPPDIPNTEHCMNYSIVHDTPGRIRLRCADLVPSARRAIALRDALTAVPGIFSAALSLRTGTLLICHSRLMPKSQVLALVGGLEPAALDAAPVPADRVAALMAERGQVPLAEKVLFWLARRLLPEPVRAALHLVKALPIAARGIWSLLRGRIDGAAVEGLAVVGMAATRRFFLVRTLLHLFSAAHKVSRLLDERQAAKSPAACRLFGRDRRVYAEIALVCLAVTGVITSWLAKALCGCAKAATVCAGLGLAFRRRGATLALPKPSPSCFDAITA